MNQLKSIYLSTSYFVSTFKEPIMIGKQSTEADFVLIELGVSEWAYITAYNPLSSLLSDIENQQRNNDLMQQLDMYHVLEGEGIGTDAAWKPEKSFFIAGISLEEAKKLAIKYSQKAIVYGRLYKPAQLIITIP
jgi:hypothetical protein